MSVLNRTASVQPDGTWFSPVPANQGQVRVRATCVANGVSRSLRVVLLGDSGGLSHGDEVNLYQTNPLLADSDGDGVADGLEIQAGSDPLDPASVNLGPILRSLSVQPTAFTLIFNTAVGEACGGST